MQNQTQSNHSQNLPREVPTNQPEIKQETNLPQQNDQNFYNNFYNYPYYSGDQNFTQVFEPPQTATPVSTWPQQPQQNNAVNQNSGVFYPENYQYYNQYQNGQFFDGSLMGQYGPKSQLAKENLVSSHLANMSASQLSKPMMSTNASTVVAAVKKVFEF